MFAGPPQNVPTGAWFDEGMVMALTHFSLLTAVCGGGCVVIATSMNASTVHRTHHTPKNSENFFLSFSRK